MSKVRLSLFLSLSLHILLFLGLRSMADHNGRGEGGFVVEMVTLHPAESAPSEEGEGVSSPSSQEEEKAAFPDEPAHLSAPVLPAGGMEKVLREENRPQTHGPGNGSATRGEPELKLAGEGDGSDMGSDGTVRSEGDVIGQGFPGGNVSPSFAIPSSGGRFNPKPRYPEAARAEGREGTTLLKVAVLPTGKVGEVVTERSSGHADLDRSAVEAVMKWTFSPARRGENPVTASVRIPVTFTLNQP